ncbi:ethylmalonyl-CoA decarboxylase-like isoform X2 [Bacillus rossius redtenbacheri]
MLAMLRYVFSRNTKEPRASSASYYSGPEVPLPEIRSFLQHRGAGSVDLVCDDSTSIATLCFNQPDKRNAISGKMMVELARAVETLEGWAEGRGVLVHGRGGHFCAGGDLHVMRDMSGPDDGFKMAAFMQDALSRLQALPLVSVALVEGSGALGGGAEIAIACDYRLLTREAAGIGFVHGRMGIAPAWGGGLRLAEVVGSRRALDLLLSARVVGWPEALDQGLADGVVDGADAITEAREWLAARTSLDARVVRAAKSIVRGAAAGGSREQRLEEERRVFAPLWGGPANKAALARYFERASAPKTKD